MQLQELHMLTLAKIMLEMSLYLEDHLCDCVVFLRGPPSVTDLPPARNLATTHKCFKFYVSKISKKQNKTKQRKKRTYF